MAEQGALAVDERQRRQARRTALLLGAVAVAIYAFYLLYAIRHGHA